MTTPHPPFDPTVPRRKQPPRAAKIKKAEEANPSALAKDPKPKTKAPKTKPTKPKEPKKPTAKTTTLRKPKANTGAKVTKKLAKKTPSAKPPPSKKAPAGQITYKDSIGGIVMSDGRSIVCY